MKRNPSFAIIIGAALLFSASCHTPYQSESLQYKHYRINPDQQPDQDMANFLKPYKDSVSNSMNGVVGTVAVGLEKKQPSSTLGNFMVDAFLAMAAEKYNTSVDVAFMNFGGIRLNQLPAGNVTRGKIFELMPFDNLLVLQKMKGSVLQEFLNITAAKGGWPVAGMTMQIKDKKAVNVVIGGKPLDPDKVYTTVNSDFVANGGDNADMLRTIPQINNGYLVRDALLDYITRLKSQGKNITPNPENRLTDAQ